LKNFLPQEFNIVVKTQSGLEGLLSEELSKIGAKEVTEHTRSVSCDGNLELLYKANLHLRTALRVLVPIFKFKARNENELYDEVKKIEWENFLTVDETLAIDATSNSEFFNHTKYIALKTKDAIVDRFRDNFGVRPNIDVIRPTIRLNLHIHQDDVTIALDSSADSLHKRGYRTEMSIAPLNEVTAAALILHSGWNGEGTFMDCMCGSGTILIEAAMIAMNIPPNDKKEWFGFMEWGNFDEKLWLKVKEEAKSAIKECKANIIGNDSVFKVIEIARANVERAGLDEYIKLSNKRFEEQKAPKEDGGVIIMNPPYGERLEISEINAFYKLMGDTLKKNFTGFDAWIITSNVTALKHLGLAASKRLTVFNGQLECKFYKYELYKGTRDPRKISQNEATDTN